MKCNAFTIWCIYMATKFFKINLLDSTRAFSATSPFIIFSDAYFADYPKFLAETKLVADEMGGRSYLE